MAAHKKRALKTSIWGLFLFLTIILTPLVSADAQDYFMAGNTRDSTYTQEGTGQWLGRAGITYTRLSTFYSFMPVIGNTDGDIQDEIIVIDGNDLLIMNFTAGVGLVTEATISQGIPTKCVNSTGTNLLTIQPTLFDADSDNINDIITTNGSHLLHYEWNGTAYITLNTNFYDIECTLDPTVNATRHPTIKCAQGSQWASGNDTCAMFFPNRTAGGNTDEMVVWDLGSNTANFWNFGTVANSDLLYKNIHLADGDGDGFLEIYKARHDASNGDLSVQSVEVSSSSVPTGSVLLFHNLAANRPFTDIIVSNLDGVTANGLEITWGFSSDDTNFDAYTIRASTGAAVTTSYCSVLTCPEGDMIGVNMFLDSQAQYGNFANDVCYYLRNYENNDPGRNIDTVMCLSQSAGADFTETEIVNTVNFSTNPVIHEVNLFGSDGLLTPRFGIRQNAVQTFPSINERRAVVPIDAQRVGALDMISNNATRLTYYDDLYTNQLPIIESQTIGTGNPVCVGVVQRITPTVTDAENNAVTCFVEQRWLNGTGVANTTNNTFTPPLAVEFQLTQTLVGTFNLETFCTDGFNDNFATRSYVMTVSNDTNVCKQQDQAPVTTEFISDSDEAEDAEFIDSIDQTLDNMAVSSPRARAVVWLFIMAAVAIGSVLAMVQFGADGTMVFFTTLIVELVTMLIGWYTGFIGTIVLVMVGLLLALILTILITTRLVSEG